MTGRGVLNLAILALAIALLLLALAAFAAELGLDAALRQSLAAGGAVLALIAAPLAFAFARRHFDGLHRLSAALGGIASQPGRLLAERASDNLDTELADLWRQIAELSQRRSPEQQIAARLAAIVAALPQPMIVIGPQALVTLANQPARELLGAGELQAGTSVFDAIDRASLAEILPRLTQDGVLETTLRLTSGETCEAHLRALPGDGGAVIALQGRTSGATGMVHALELHDAIPPRTAPQPETPLAGLSVMVLDCETTGLNVGLDRIVSLGAVRIQGTRIVSNETLDLLVNPGQPIPQATTEIHGITDAMVFGQPALAQQWPRIEAALRDCVVVGHNIGFDLTLLGIELRRAGIRWQRPASLCTLQLASALEPKLQDLNLEALARTYGIAVSGRHTALGDALLTADLYLHLLALMQAKGDRTLADAQARAATARRVIRQQEAAGW